MSYMLEESCAVVTSISAVLSLERTVRRKANARGWKSALNMTGTHSLAISLGVTLVLLAGKCLTHGILQASSLPCCRAGTG